MLTFVFYVGNLTPLFLDFSKVNPAYVLMPHGGWMVVAFPVTHLWSLCVEEQFYFMWPVAIWLIRDRRKLMQTSAVVILATILLRTAVRATHHFASGGIPVPPVIYLWTTFFRCDALLVGAFAALWLRGRKLSKVQLRTWSTCLILFSGSTLGVGIFLSHCFFPKSSYAETPFMISVGFTLIAIGYVGFLLLSLDESGVLSRILQWQPLYALGVISYGFYFFHLLPQQAIAHIAKSHSAIRPFVPLMAFVATGAVAALSFRYYESRFLKLKSRLAPGHKSVPSGEEAIT